MSAELTEITQMDIALDFAGRVNAKMQRVGIKTARYGCEPSGRQIMVGVDIDGQRVAEQILVGASDEVVDDMVSRFAELVEAKSKIFVSRHARKARAARRERQNRALRTLLTD